MRPCYTSFVKTSDVPYGNYDTDITNPLALFRLSRPITRVCETTRKATDVFVSNKILDLYTVHCLILDNKRRSTEDLQLSLIHISEPTRLLSISYAVFCLKKKNTKKQKRQNHIIRKKKQKKKKKKKQKK